MTPDALRDVQDVLEDDLVFDGGVIRKGATKLATYVDAENRFDWDWRALGVDASLIALAEEEARTWNDWAHVEPAASYPLSPTLGLWRSKYPALARSMDDAGVDLELEGKRILDIGGSGKDLIYWLEKKPRSIDQIEVSRSTQLFLLDRLERAGHRRGDAGMLRLHTIPAEKLPFRSASMDFVFSRATLHHCRRPEVLEEVVRVLKPGGVLCFIENYRGPLAYELMRAHRFALRRDRGSDDPLQWAQLEYLEARLNAGVGRGSRAPFAITFHDFMHDWSRLDPRIRELLRHLPQKHSALSVSVAARKG